MRNERIPLAGHFFHIGRSFCRQSHFDLRKDALCATERAQMTEAIYIHGGGGLGLLLIERVKEIARRIKGVTRVQIPYRDRCFLRL
jgi:hypothetical protein